MSEDKEIEAINQKKLKAKGAKVVEEKKTINYEAIIMQLSTIFNDRGLEMMNIGTELRNVIANERQRKLEQINKPDNEKQ